MSFARHPLWQAGFRPFFPLAALAGAVLPLAWLGLLLGYWQWPSEQGGPGQSAVQWHAHEMFFGFGGAVLVGFLLTASKNWVGIAGYRGNSLIVLTVLWLFERLTVTAGTHWPPVLFWTGILAFTTLAVAMLLHTLIRHRAQDTFAPDNLFFLLILPLLLPAKVLVLLPETQAAGVVLTNGIFRMAFLLMLERTVPAFLKGTLQRSITPTPRMDRTIKWLGLILCTTPWLPENGSSVLEGLLAGLLLVRLRGWHLRAALSRLEIGIMLVGYGAIVAQLGLDAAAHFGLISLPGSVARHVFTLGTLGCIVPAMFIRIAQGHTGRRITFGRRARAILWLAIIALLSRTVGVTLWPTGYLAWIATSAIAWALAFGLWFMTFAGWMRQPRIDGKAG